MLVGIGRQSETITIKNAWCGFFDWAGSDSMGSLFHTYLKAIESWPWLYFFAYGTAITFST